MSTLLKLATVTRNAMGIQSKSCTSVLGGILQRWSGGDQDHGHSKIAARYLSMQQNLPKLPVPPLHQTMDKYLASVRPLVDDDEYAHTKQLVEEFQKPGGLGEMLQKQLQERAKRLDNWMSDWWLEGAYLTFRMPVVVHSSPAIVFPTQDFSGIQGQIRYASKLITGILDYKQMVDDGAVPVQYAGKEPLDMSQFYLVLNSCRVPGKKMDSLVTHPPTKPNPPRHITVMHNNHIFAVDVYGRDGHRLNTLQIHHQLEHVCSESQFAAPPVGILTSENRNSWAHSYHKLIKDRQNKVNMELIQKSILTVCLDQPVGCKKQSKDLQAVGQMMHGGGHEHNSGNRWFDKTIQIIVGCDGTAGTVYEHSTAEGPALTAILDHALSYIDSGQSSRHLPATNVTTPTRLKFNLSPAVQEDIETAKRHLSSLIRDVDICRSVFDGFGKAFIKQHKISPDAYFQLALHLTFYRLHGEAGACYETASVRKFLYGRTETIRSCTTEAMQFCRAMVEAHTSPSVRADLLRSAVSKHSQYTRDCQEGQGVDRHLFGLKRVAIEEGLNVPDLFMDAAFSASTHFRLSTSQVPTQHEMCMFFGPSCPDGYGICYNPQQNKFIYVVTAFNSSPQTSATQFSQTLQQSLTDMQALLLKAKL